MSFGLEVSKVAIGALLGSGLAFFFNGVHAFIRRHQENVASANLALVTIINMMNEFLRFRTETFYDLTDARRTPGGPVWAMMRPSAQRFAMSEIDLKSVAFLFEGQEYLAAINGLLLAQHTYRGMVAMHEFRNEAAVAIYEQTSAGAFRSDREAEDAIGPQRIATMKIALTNITLMARDDEGIYRTAHASLLAAAEASLSPRPWWWRIYPWRAPAFAKMGPVLDPHLRQDNLPTLPASIQELLDAHDHQRASAAATLANPR
jgi:hypothetical protein